MSDTDTDKAPTFTYRGDNKTQGDSEPDEAPKLTLRDVQKEEAPKLTLRDVQKEEAPELKLREKGTPEQVIRSGDLRSPDAYTAKDLQDPYRALLARTLGVEDRLAGASDPWWKGAYTPLAAEGEVVGEDYALRGDKDLSYYAGVPQHIDNIKGWARSATPEEIEKSRAARDSMGEQRELAATVLGRPDSDSDSDVESLVWDSEEARDAALKLRLNPTALTKDGEIADAFLKERDALLKEEIELYNEIQDAFQGILKKYSAEVDPDSKIDLGWGGSVAVAPQAGTPEMEAVLKKIQSDASVEERELLIYGGQYSEAVLPRLEELGKERQTGARIYAHLQKAGWVRGREKATQRVKGLIIGEARAAASPTTGGGGEPLARAAIETKGTGETGETLESYRPGEIRTSTGTEFSYGKLTFQGRDFESLAADPVAYQAAIEEAAGLLDPAVVQQMIAHKRAVGVLAAYEKGTHTTVPLPRSASGEHFESEAERNIRRGTTRTRSVLTPSEPVAEKWAREVVFYQEVLAHTQSRVKSDLDALAELSGLSAEEVATVTLNLSPPGSEERTAFNWDGAVGILQKKQAEIIAQSFGFENLEQVAARSITVGEFSDGDLSKVTYSYTDETGQEILVKKAPSNHNASLLGYINEVAQTRAKQIIKDKLMTDRKMVFVKGMTSEQRANQARGTGVPLLYMIGVHRPPEHTVSISPEGEMKVSGEFFEEYSIMDHTIQVFNGFIAYGGAAGTELWRQGVYDDFSQFVVDDRGDINWAGIGTVTTGLGFFGVDGQHNTHAVRKGETLKQIADYYFGKEPLEHSAWIEDQRALLGLREGQEPSTGTVIEIDRDYNDVLWKGFSVLAGISEGSQLYSEMDRRRTLFATEQMMELAEWTSHGLDTPLALETEAALFGTLFGAGGVYLDVRAPDPFTGTLVVGGKTLKWGRAMTLARQQKQTTRALRRATEEAVDFDSLMLELEKLNPGADAYYHMRVAHAMGVDPNVGAQLRFIENQIEQEKLAIRQLEQDSAQLTLDVEKAGSRQRIAEAQERVNALQVQQYRHAIEVVEGQIAQLNRSGALRALESYQKDLKAAEVAEFELNTAKGNKELYENGSAFTTYQRNVERHRAHLQAADENLVAAKAELEEQKTNVRTATVELTTQKRTLEARLKHLKEDSRERLKRLQTEQATQRELRGLTPEMLARARRVGIEPDLVRPPKNFRAFGAAVRRAEVAAAKRGVPVEPDAIQQAAKDIKASAPARKNSLGPAHKRQVERMKAEDAAAKKELVDEIKALRSDVAGLRWTGKGAKARPTMRGDLSNLTSKRSRAAEQFTNAKDVALRSRQQLRTYLKGSKDIPDAFEKLLKRATRAQQAHDRLMGKAWGRVAAHAPGVRMGALNKGQAVRVLEDTVADLTNRRLELDNLLAGSKKEYTRHLRANAKMSAKGANQQLDSLLRTQDRKARLEASVRGYEEQAEVWRNVALKMANEIEQGNKLLKDVFPDTSPRFVDLLEKGTIRVDVRTGERVLDTKMLKESLEDKFGADAIEHFFKAQPELSLPLKKALRTPGEITVSGEQVFSLQQLQEGLLRAREAVHPHAEAIATVRAIAQAKGDLDMMRAAMASSSRVKRVGSTFLGVLGLRPDWWTVVGHRLERALNPIKNRIGYTAEEQYQVLKAADFEVAMINEDMRLISRMAHEDHKYTLGLPGGADGVLIEQLNAAKRAEGSKRAVGLYEDLVDGNVKIISTRPLREVEKPELIAALEKDVADQKIVIAEVDRLLAIEAQIPGHAMRNEALKTTATEVIEAETLLTSLADRSRLVSGRVDSFSREIAAEAGLLEQEAAMLEVATRISDVEHAVLNHYKAAMSAREAGDVVAFESRMFDAAKASGQFSPGQIASLQERVVAAARGSVDRKKLGATKVVDPDTGEPLVVYHGTTTTFKDFEMHGRGAHFGSAEQANQRLRDIEMEDLPWSYEAAIAPPTVGSIRPVYLRMERPLTMVDIGQWDDVVTFGRALSEIFPENQTIKGIVERALSKRPTAMRRGTDIERELPLYDELIKAVRAEGYDGIKYTNEIEIPEEIAEAILQGEKVDPRITQSYFVFEPSQVLSRFGGPPRFPVAEETVLRNSAAAVESKITEPSRLRAQAEDLRSGLDKGTHPRQLEWDNLKEQFQGAIREEQRQEKVLLDLKKKLEQLQADHLPEELLNTLAGRQQVARLKHELKQAEDQLAVRIKDMEEARDGIDALVPRMKAKAADILAALDALKKESKPVSDRYLAAYHTGDEAVLAETTGQLAEIDRRIAVLEQERSRYLVRGADGEWKANLGEGNPLTKREDQLFESHDVIHDEVVALRNKIENTLRPRFRQATSKIRRG